MRRGLQGGLRASQSFLGIRKRKSDVNGHLRRVP